MRFKRFMHGKKLISTAFVMLMSLSVFAQLNRASGQIPLGNSDIEGYARFDRVLPSLDLGGGAKADLFLMFSSNMRLAPNAFGLYWHCPLLESRLVKTHDIMYKWIPPNNGGYSFFKTPKKVKGWDEVYEMKGRGGWTLKMNKKTGDALIEKLSDSAAKYEFKNGRLAGFCAGAGADRIRISYDSKGIAQSVYNITKGRTLLDLRYDRGLLVSMKIDNPEKSEIKFTYAPCETFAEDGVSKYKDASLSSVSRIDYADGKVEEFTYTGEKQKSRTLSKRNGSEEYASNVVANKLTLKSGESESFVTWDAANGIVMSDSGGVYSIANPTWDTRNPEFKENQFNTERQRGDVSKHVRLSYKRPDNKFAEIWENNNNTAVRIFQNPDTGEMKRVSYIGAQGASYMRERKVERKHADEKDWTTDLVKAYNDKGSLIREMHANGDVKEWILKGDKQNGTFEELRNGEKIKSETYKSGEKIYEMRKIGENIYEAITEKDLSKIQIKKNGEQINEYEI